MRLLSAFLVLTPVLALADNPQSDTYITAGFAWSPKIGDMPESMKGMQATVGHELTNRTALELTGYSFNSIRDEDRSAFFFVSSEASASLRLDNIFSASVLHRVDTGYGDLTLRLGWYTVDLDYEESTTINVGLPFFPPIEVHQRNRWSNDGPLLGVGYERGGFRIEAQGWVNGADAPPFGEEEHFGMLVLSREFRW